MEVEEDGCLLSAEEHSEFSFLVVPGVRRCTEKREEVLGDSDQGLQGSLRGMRRSWPKE